MIIPAIDIIDGACVRLTQGNYNLKKIYDTDPIRVALKWQKEGAKYLHIVDLDGAKIGSLQNIETISSIAQALDIPIQVGGGIRSLEHADKLFKAGVSRIIIGTIALENRALLDDFVHTFADRIIVALDANNGTLVTHGWIQKTKNDYIKTAQELVSIGVKQFMYTDTIKDGMLTGPNYPDIKRLVSAVSVPVIVGGGISNIDHIEKLNKIGVHSIVVGKALYEEVITLKQINSLGI